ncbi:MAG TPA: bifunctional ADP-dependent NAD(P)H-hydrate dehydratase/NAD(P)H-hydrate epimerase [Nocardioidaceae bacterium]|nr:bifunctional ADP-dependent NAD(P)H-hydrate dehydratase/NAD(P)H-hydrate epimerase [Nocardioidaceae bacterium]
MRYAHTVEQVRAAEVALLAELPDGTLMRRAAAGLAAACLDFLGHGYGARVGMLVGAGDNGGDALFAGALLARRGARVEAVLLSEHVHGAGAAALRAAGGSAVPRLGRCDLVVDGIVGIGGRPGLRPDAVSALDAVAGTPIVAVDVPSGIDVDTGEAPDPHVRADLTVTFGTHKVALLVGPATSAAGAVHLVDIGLTLPAPVVESLQASDVASLLPVPVPGDDKYRRGVVGVDAGSAGYPGAAVLAVSGALAGFAGMVRFAGAEETARGVRSAHPEVVGPGRVQSWVVGPGSGDRAGERLEAACRDGVPVLVDADALAGVHGPLGAPALLTPHAGELARMLGVDRGEIEAAPLRHARRAAERFDATVLLKGDRTLVVDPSGRVRVNTTGVPWLATAGAGDVLSGLCGSLLAAGLSALDAGSVGAWLHGAAAARASSGGPITAGDVASAVPAVVASLR